MMTTNDDSSKAYGELVARMGGPENATKMQKHLCRVAVNLCQEIDGQGCMFHFGRGNPT